MISYIIVFCIVGVFAWLAEKSHKEVTDLTGDVLHKKTASTIIFLIIAGGLLTAMAGLRYHVGTDYKNYIYLYETFYSRQSFSELLNLEEPILPIIGNLSYRFFDSYYSMFFIASLITVGLTLYSTYKETTDFLFITFIYIFTGSWHGTFNGVRQYLAVAIIFLGRHFIIERKFWKYLLVCFIAFLAHKSALFCVLFYFVYSKKFSTKRLLIVLGVTLFLSFNYETIFDFIGWMNDNEFVADAYATTSVNIFRILVGCCPAIMGLYFAYNNKDLDELQIFYIYMLVANAATRIATSDSAYLARLACYPAVFVPLGLGYLTDLCSQKYYKVFRAGILIMYFAYWLYEVTNTKTLYEFEWIFGRV